MSQKSPTIQATNIHYYYQNLDQAWAFYHHTMGLETVADYGDSKVMQLCQNAYLTLTNIAQSAHSPDAPKSVTTAFVTEQVAEWYSYLQAQNVPIHRPYTVKEGSAHDGFVALDPEGYFLEFEVFNAHAENDQILPTLAKIKPIFTRIGDRPSTLSIQAVVHWLYYHNLAPIEQFYESLLGVSLMVDQGWAKVYQIAGGGFIGLVDGREGLHKVSAEKCVTVGFMTDTLAEWQGVAQKDGGLFLEAVAKNGRLLTLTSSDPEGYLLKWDNSLKPAS